MASSSCFLSACSSSSSSSSVCARPTVTPITPWASPVLAPADSTLRPTSTTFHSGSGHLMVGPSTSTSTAGTTTKTTTPPAPAAARLNPSTKITTTPPHWTKYKSKPMDSWSIHCKKDAWPAHWPNMEQTDAGNVIRLLLANWENVVPKKDDAAAFTASRALMTHWLHSLTGSYHKKVKEGLAESIWHVYEGVGKEFKAMMEAFCAMRADPKLDVEEAMAPVKARQVGEREAERVLVETAEKALVADRSARYERMEKSRREWDRRNAENDEDPMFHYEVPAGADFHEEMDLWHEQRDEYAWFKEDELQVGTAKALKINNKNLYGGSNVGSSRQSGSSSEQVLPQEQKETVENAFKAIADAEMDLEEAMQPRQARSTRGKPTLKRQFDEMEDAQQPPKPKRGKKQAPGPDDAVESIEFDEPEAAQVKRIKLNMAKRIKRNLSK